MKKVAYKIFNRIVVQIDLAIIILAIKWKIHIDPNNIL